MKHLMNRTWYRPSILDRIRIAIFGPSKHERRVDAILERIDRLRAVGPRPRSELPFIRHRRRLEG